MREISRPPSETEKSAQTRGRGVEDVSAAPVSHSGTPREAFLCWCEKVTHDAFRRAVSSAPEEQFYDLCRATGVGTKCTSCLLDAEAAYDEAARQPMTRIGTTAAPRRTDRLNAKRTLYAWLDRLSPRAVIPMRGIVPVLAGAGISTTVSVSNSSSRAIGAHSPRFAVQLDLRDADGRSMGSVARTLAPGERLDHEVPPWTDGEGLSTGSCRVSMKALGNGYRGSIRPHFTVKTTRSISCVHSQSNGRRTAFLRTVARPQGETQYLSVVNCEPEAASIQVRATRDGDELMIRRVTIAPLGAMLIELAVPFEQRHSSKPIVAELKSDRRLRTHIVVAAGDPARISLHHI